MHERQRYDVVIVGGGPGGLSAALALGRSRRRVLLCDSGPRRNASAQQIHNFLTRDGTSPHEFRQLAREQLKAYPNVEAQEKRVESITGRSGDFSVHLTSGTVEARRVLLATGMVDEMLPIPGFAELWGQSIFQCPYCHGWEAQNRRWGYLPNPHEPQIVLPFALQLRAWTDSLVVFTNGTFSIPSETRLSLEHAGIRLEESPISRLLSQDGTLTAVELTKRTIACDFLFSHPPQRQVALIRNLGVALDEGGYVRAEPVRRETSTPGIFAVGDMASRGQAAILAAAAGTEAAALINVELAMEVATRAVHTHDGHHARHHAGDNPFSGADHWAREFEDPERDEWQQPDRILEALALEPSMTVADIGSGTGYFAVRLARALPKGEVLAVDTEPDMIRHLRQRAQDEQLPNLKARQATSATPGLAEASVDRVLIVQAWHHVADRRAYARDLARSLRPGGKILIVEHNPTASRAPPTEHRLHSKDVIAELKAAGLTAKISSVPLFDQFIVEAERA